MPYKVGVFIKTKEAERLERWLPTQYDNYDVAADATDVKNRQLGVPETGLVPPGHRFAMFDAA